MIPAYTFVCDRTLLQAIVPTFPRLIFCITLSSEEILGAIAVQRVRCLQRTARALTSLRGRC
ncbi:hypothetical protein [Fischerella sp. PCC 9605]|uniref:hypothetical protein n=1 Tax=Fischerella sp. PCC 9605 TaxID=1173024 RepID=UPI0012DD42AB|nr:hypothetical protein [Fischerella sp. PCC 9605]